MGPLPGMGDMGRAGVEGGGLSHVEFELSVRHPSAQWIAGYNDMELRGRSVLEIRLWDLLTRGQCPQRSGSSISERTGPAEVNKGASCHLARRGCCHVGMRARCSRSSN